MSTSTGQLGGIALALFIRRPRIVRKPRIIPRSVGVGPVRVSRRGTSVSAGPFVWFSPRKRRRK